MPAHCLFESLEPRRLLHATGAHAGGSIRINFQPATTTVVPAGYVADVGQDYGLRGNGHRYGWKSHNEAGAVDRDDPASDDRYDTFNVLTRRDQWAVEVPDGTYSVHLVAGDPSAFNSSYKINVEGLRCVNGAPTSGARWVEGTVIVNISDGAITVHAAPGSVNVKLDYIDVTRVAGPVPTVPQEPRGLSATAGQAGSMQLAWTDTSDNELGFQVYRREGTGGWKRRATVPANVTSFLDAKVEPGRTYAYRIRAANDTGNGAYTAGTPGVLVPAAFSTIIWTQRASSPIIRAEALRAVVDDRLYVFGGFQGNDGPVTRSDAYNPRTNSWTRIADLPRRLTHAGVAVVGRNIYIAGGYVGTGNGFQQQFGTDEVWRFNVDTQQWSAMPALPKAVSGGGFVALGDTLHWFGGNDSKRHDIADHFTLSLSDPSAGWTAAAALPVARSHLGYAVLDGRIYAIGGQTGNDAGLATHADVNVWDPAHPGAWSSVASLPAPVSHIASATFAMNGWLFVMGGESEHEHPVDSVYGYNPAANAWQTLTPLPAPRFSGVAAGIDGAVIFTTGSSQTTTWRGVFTG